MKGIGVGGVVQEDKPHFIVVVVLCIIKNEIKRKKETKKQILKVLSAIK